MKALKTVLMWYSGFVMMLFLIVSVVTINEPTECVEGTTQGNIVFVLFLAPIVAYLVWEIVDHLKENKK